MPAILRSEHGYYSVDSWDNVFQCCIVTSHEAREAYRGMGIYEFVAATERMNEARRQGQLPEDAVYLGNWPDYEDDIGVHQTFVWAKSGHFHYEPTV